MVQRRNIRILIGKPGLDGHDRGAKLVAKALSDAGFEVVYTGRHQTVQQIVSAAVQEDIDVIGLSILSGAHLNYAAQLFELMKQEKMDDVMVLFGGNIPQSDIGRLKEIGVKEIFPTSSSFESIVSYVRNSFA